MSQSVHRVSATLLMILTGCASPMFSGMVSRGHQGPASSDRDVAADSGSSAATRDLEISKQKLTESRAAARDTPRFERRIHELLLAASRSRRAGELAAARTSYDQVLRIDAGNSEAHYWLAVIADDQGRFVDAERHYSVLLKQNPRDPNVLASLGWSQLLQGRYEDSEQTLRNALVYAPTHQTALYNLGWLYGTRGNYDQALAIFRSAGSEADAQRAIAELAQTSKRSESAASAEAYPAVGSAAPLPNDRTLLARNDASRERQSSHNLSAPDPWNDRRSDLTTVGPQPGYDRSGDRPLAQSANPSSGFNRPAPPQINGSFAEIDRYANSSPAQANHPRQAESQAQFLGVEPGVSGLAGMLPGRMEPTKYEQSPSSRNGPPVITPGASASARNTNTDRNSPSSLLGAVASSIGPDNPPTSSGRTGTTLPEWMAAGSDRSDAAPPSAADRRPGRDPAYEAQLVAAQLGLCAGTGAPVFFAVEPENPAGDTTTSLRPTPSIPAATGTSPPMPPAPALSDRPKIAPRPSNEAEYSLPAETVPRTSSLPPWPGRPSVASPIPTEVVPSAETPGLSAGGSSPAVNYSAGRPVAPPSR
jgi:Tfp pilus assembly protein PilF